MEEVRESILHIRNWDRFDLLAIASALESRDQNTVFFRHSIDMDVAH